MLRRLELRLKHKNKRWGHLNARNAFDRMLLEMPVAAPTGRGGRGGTKCMFRHLQADPAAQETGISLYPALYPVSVNCTQLVRVDVVRFYPRKGTVTSTITARASTTTTTTTSTATTTTTIGSGSSASSRAAAAASTSTSSVTTVVSSTTTSVSTTFSTLTNTFTVAAPAETAYAACAPNNTVSRVNGHPIASGAQDLLAFAEATSPRDCCEMQG
ncbi:hypothetical protein UCDDS831_g07358 [Diplodia seriata]|uniref:Uncharacterized protein n=1 Tax=Diplodia seriata TaxID=420778 RepID=A0A0G2DZJ4_9PEZI|nr:hypothetical protein UCDDS831_g07358 [Diplodia seriata]